MSICPEDSFSSTRISLTIASSRSLLRRATLTIRAASSPRSPATPGLQQPQRALDRGQRCAQFVTDGRDRAQPDLLGLLAFRNIAHHRHQRRGAVGRLVEMRQHLERSGRVVDFQMRARAFARQDRRDMALEPPLFILAETSSRLTDCGSSSRFAAQAGGGRFRWHSSAGRSRRRRCRPRRATPR
jgi:hypothetical protein